jgi:hypothetical protein
MDLGTQAMHQANMTSHVKGDGTYFVKMLSDGQLKTPMYIPEEFIIFSPWHLLHDEGQPFQGDIESRFRHHFLASHNAFPAPPPRDDKGADLSLVSHNTRRENKCRDSMERHIKAQYDANLPTTKTAWEALYHPALMLFEAFFNRRAGHKRVVAASTAWDTKWRQGTADPSSAWLGTSSTGGKSQHL